MSDGPVGVVGAILCGGSSRRMGEPKALVELDGRPLAALAADALTAAGSERVVLVGGEPAWGRSLGLPLVADRWPGEGPLGGLATAVLDGPGGDGDRDTIVLVTACDQPWLEPAGLADLAAALRDRPQAAAAAPRTDDGRIHPLPSAWRARAGGRLATLMNSGARRADAGFGLVTLVEVPFGSRAVADVDEPADLPGHAPADPGPA